MVLNKRFKGYLLVSDMDGTLINSKGEISDENINAIESFIKEGGVFTIATGRRIESTRRYLNKLPVTLPIILYNGTKIYDFIKNKTIFEVFLEEKIKNLIKKLNLYDSSLGIEIYCDEKVYIFNPCRFTKRFEKKGYTVNYEIPKNIWDKKWTKILILGEEKQMDKLEENFKIILEKVNLIRSGENYLEILPCNISKGYTLKKLCNILKIDESKVIAVGDNMNDFEMLMNAKYGFCVDNGNKKLKDKANYICSSNDKHAIEYVINWIKKSAKI